MTIPDETDPCWMNALTSDNSPRFELLATKIILGRLSLIYEMDPSPETAHNCISELRSYFVWNKDIPKAQMDLQVITRKAVDN